MQHHGRPGLSDVQEALDAAVPLMRMVAHEYQEDGHTHFYCQPSLNSPLHPMTLEITGEQLTPAMALENARYIHGQVAARDSRLEVGVYVMDNTDQGLMHGVRWDGKEVHAETPSEMMEQ